jgi:hypothetical protein
MEIPLLAKKNRHMFYFIALEKTFVVLVLSFYSHCMQHEIMMFYNIYLIIHKENRDIFI